MAAGGASYLDGVSKAQARRDFWTAMAFLLPNLTGFLIFVTFPILFSLFLVFTNWSLKPAVHTEFVGLTNIWRLVGFRPIPGIENAGGIGWLAAYLGSYILIAGGIGVTFIDVARRLPGLRLGAAILAGGGALAFLGGFFGLGGGGALFGLVILFFAFMLLLTDDERAIGAGARGPAMVVVALPLIYLLTGPFFARWEPLDVNFYKYLYNTLYLMMAMPFQIAGSLVLALLLTKPLVDSKGRLAQGLTLGFAAISVAGLVGFGVAGYIDLGVLWALFWAIAALGTSFGMVSFRTLFYLPSFTAGVAVMLLWKQVFNPNFGPLNESLRMMFDTIGLHREPPRWLLDPAWAKPALMLMGLWMNVGGSNMLLYVAGLANVPGELYEAADMDGANRWQTFKNVTWPQLAPTTFFIVIMTMIAGIQGGFEQARIMTQGGPAGSTKTISYYIFEKAFEELSLGYASAIAWVLFTAIFLLTLLNWKFGNRYVNE